MAESHAQAPTLPLAMPLEEAMRAQRSIQRLHPDPVDDALLPIGRYGPTTRKPVGDVVHFDRYGNRPYAEAKR